MNIQNDPYWYLRPLKYNGKIGRLLQMVKAEPVKGNILDMKFKIEKVEENEQE